MRKESHDPNIWRVQHDSYNLLGYLRPSSVQRRIRNGLNNEMPPLHHSEQSNIKALQSDIQMLDVRHYSVDSYL